MGWARIKLGELCSKITDGSHNPPKGVDYSEHIMLSSKNVFDDKIHLDKPRFLTESDFVKENKRTDVSVDDVLLTIVGTVGRVAVVDESLPKFTLQRSVAVLKPLPDKIVARFLMYSLRSILEELLGESRGVAQKGIYLKSLREMHISVPSIPDQKRIVAILDQAFADIDNARALTEQNLKNARELFESYLQQVFSQRGGGWVEKKLCDVCILQRGFDLPKRLRASGEYPLVSSSGVIDTNIEAKVPGPGVVTGRSGSIGNVFYIEEDFWPLNTTLYIKEFFGNDKKCVSWLLRYFDLSRFTSGAGVPTLNRNFVHDEVVAIPTEVENQRNIVVGIEALEAEILTVKTIYEDKLNKLDELKKSLLQKAFSGEITKDDKEAAA
ncbi:MAG: hypothetical protein CMN84_11075 [Spongiibacteraceae bacterium]|jgi:type I restriction enzyme, S subunit|nr:hypothetical protein [Spongiibacteraceae bacterium]|tara:strand:+ start:120 stop:1265 length:1146 start_codon:yes stop_codon:yes gene_type:complete